MGSVWSKDKSNEIFRHLEGDLKTDVLIIGGGMAGVLTAYFLDKAGVDYALVEGGRIGCGITKNTTAKITAQHGLIYDKIIKSYGLDKAKQYLMSNLSALEQFEKLCEGIDCDYEKKDSFVYSITDRRKLEDELNALQKLGYGADFCQDMPIPIKTRGAVRFPNQAQFNPIKFLNEISKGLNIYEHTYVEKIKGHKALHKNGVITADKIIITTHFPMINLSGLYSVKLYQHRSYVIALPDAQDVSGMYVDEAKNGMSFRNYKNLLLIGGGDHRTGKIGGGWRELRYFAKRYYPDSAAKEQFNWATQDCMSLDSIPYIGPVSGRYPHIYLASGFNKWGMSSSMVSGMILSDMVRGQRNDYADVFDPSRSMFHIQLGVNAFEAVIHLLWPTVKRCSHLGCGLKWNPDEHTWDCPCHGSRYSGNGQLIDNPAKKNIKV